MRKRTQTAELWAWVVVTAVLGASSLTLGCGDDGDSAGPDMGALDVGSADGGETSSTTLDLRNLSGSRSETGARSARGVWFHAVRDGVAGSCPSIELSSGDLVSPGPAPSDPDTCLYEWRSKGMSSNEQRPTATEVEKRTGATTFPLNLGPEAVLDDARRWTTLNDDEKDRRRRLRAYYLAKVGAFTGVPDTPPANPVRVIVLDDLEAPMAISADGSELLPNTNSCSNLHGISVARVVQDVACGTAGGDCNVEIWAYNALPIRMKPDATAIERHPACSRVGDVITFAEAVDRIISDHQGFTGDIIVNASIGANLAGEPEARDQLLESLRKLFCFGAVVVAATGNDLSTGAQLEDQSFKDPSRAQIGTPMQLECTGAVQRSGFANDGSNLSEHILAVAGANARGPTTLKSGTEVDGTTLALSRFEDNVAVAAYAQSVVTSLGTGSGEVLLPPTSGTSMATAVVSGGLAAVAGYLPPGSLPSLIANLRANMLGLPEVAYMPVLAPYNPIASVSAFTLLEKTCGSTCISGLAGLPVPSRPGPAYVKTTAMGTPTLVSNWPDATPGWTVSETPLLSPEPPGIGACRECPLINNELHLDFSSDPTDTYYLGNYENFFLQLRRDDVDELYELKDIASGALSVPGEQGTIDNAKITATYVPTGQTVASEVEVHDPDVP